MAVSDEWQAVFEVGKRCNGQERENEDSSRDESDYGGCQWQENQLGAVCNNGGLLGVKEAILRVG
jgi:hypothetical protein